MKWLKTRFLPVSYLALLALLVVVGCTNKTEPSEVLDLCGNHSCGDLAMVTTDTSSEGFHYLGPTLSPDGTRILFSADWLAIPVSPRFDEDARETMYRQIIVMDLPDPLYSPRDPEASLSEQEAILVRLSGASTYLEMPAGRYSPLTNMEDKLRKGDPIWVDDERIIFWCQTPRGNRLFRANIAGICADAECKAYPTNLYLEQDDLSVSGAQWQHMQPSLSPDGEWLAFTRSGCAIADSFETCTQVTLQVMRMSSTIGAGVDGYDAEVFSVTSEVSRLEKPNWSSDGSKLIFSAGMDMDGQMGAGTELYTIDFDTTGLAAGEVVLDNNLERLTHTSYADGDPISGIYNTAPSYTADGSEIVFVSTRRAPSITLHDRNLWKIPADGNLEPEILFFTRADDVDPQVLPNGSILLSSQLGFPTNMLNRLEEEAYQKLLEDNADLDRPLTEVQMRSLAADERRQLEFFHGVMSHLYVFNP